jgi:hypothetical protein
MTTAFICYCKEDRAIALRLREDLERSGVSTWIDKKNLLPGQEWELEIPAAIRRSDLFLALMSKRSVDKHGYVQKELRIALDVLDEFPPGDVFVIPVRLEPCEPRHDQLKNKQRVDLFPNFEDGLEQILRAIPCVDGAVAIRQEDRNRTAWILYDFLRHTHPQVLQQLQQRTEPLRVLVSSSRMHEIEGIMQREDTSEYASVRRDHNYIANMVGLPGYSIDVSGQPWTGYIFTFTTLFFDLVT